MYFVQVFFRRAGKSGSGLSPSCLPNHKNRRKALSFRLSQELHSNPHFEQKVCNMDLIAVRTVDYNAANLILQYGL